LGDSPSRVKTVRLRANERKTYRLGRTSLG
jgi:hypothetical protein